MSNAIATIQPAAVDLVTEDRIKRWSQTFANGAPERELQTFVEVVRRTGLSPEARQIYFIRRGGKWAHQVSIDGFRLIAERTGRYAGSDEPVYASSGQKVGQKPRPDKATVTVWKLLGGERFPFTASALWDEYAVAGNDMWGRMPHTMLAKCAESLALRKAFPAELSGLYTDTEMDQADAPITVHERPARVEPDRSVPVPHAMPGTRVMPAADAQPERTVDTSTGEIIDAEAREVDPDAPQDWTAFWKWARANKLGNKAAVEGAIGRPIEGLQPDEVYYLLRAAEMSPDEEAQAPKPAEPDDVRPMNKLHGVGAERNLTHDDLHLLGWAGGFTSLKEMSADELLGLAAWVEEAADEDIADEIATGRKAKQKAGAQG